MLKSMVVDPFPDPFRQFFEAPGKRIFPANQGQFEIEPLLEEPLECLQEEIKSLSMDHLPAEEEADRSAGTLGRRLSPEWGKVAVVGQGKNRLVGKAFFEIPHRFLANSSESIHMGEDSAETLLI